MATRTRLLVIVGIGLAAFAAGMAAVWVRSQPERKFDKDAYLDEMAKFGKSLEKKPAPETKPPIDISTVERTPQESVQASPAQPQRAQTPEGPQPKIQLDGDTFDFGTIPNDKPTTKEMPVRNVGNAPLELLNVSSSCGCAVAELKPEDKTVPPGGQVPIRITFSPNRIPGFDSTKLVTIQSNDPANRTMKIKVQTKIEPEFQIEPGILDFGALNKGEAKQMTMRVRQLQQSAEPFEVKTVECLAPTKELEASFEKLPEDQWQTPGKAEYLVKVTLNTESVPAVLSTEPGAVREYSGYFSLETSCKRVTRLRCLAKAQIDSFFTVSPNAIPIYTAAPGQNQAAEVTVASNAPVTVEDPKVTGGEMTAEAVPGPKPNTVVVRVSVAGDAKVGAKEERLSFVVKSGGKTAKHSLRVYGRLVDKIARQRTHKVTTRRSGEPVGNLVAAPKPAPQAPGTAASQ